MMMVTVTKFMLSKRVNKAMNEKEEKEFYKGQVHILKVLKQGIELGKWDKESIVENIEEFLKINKQNIKHLK